VHGPCRFAGCFPTLRTPFGRFFLNSAIGAEALARTLNLLPTHFGHGLMFCNLCVVE